MRQIIPVALLLAAGALHRCRAAIVSIFDDASLASHLSGPSALYGMTIISSSLMLITGIDGPIFSDPLFGATQTVNPVELYPSFGVHAGLSVNSLFTSFGTSFLMTGAGLSFYTFDTVTNGPAVLYNMDLPATSGAIAVSESGQVYIDPLGAASPAIYDMAFSPGKAHFNLIAQLSPYVTNAVGLGVGPNALLYTMGPATANLGNCTISEWCVVAFDPTSGNLVYNFPVPESLLNGALAFGPSGLLFLAGGDGQGYVFNSTGGLLDTLSSTAVNPYAPGGRTLLAVDGNNDVYMFDTATGLHVFDAEAPEPGTAWLLVAGIVLLTGRAANARGRNRDNAQVGKPY